MIERRDFARHQRRRHKARPMRHKIAEALRVRRGVKRNEKALGGRRRVADEHQIEARRFVSARGFRHIAGRQAALDDMQCGVASRRRDACLLYTSRCV